MGYSTDFSGMIELDRKADEETIFIMKGLTETRRMKRNVDESLYGKEGEFYFNFDGDFGQTHEDNIVNYNTPPGDQPSLWCQWVLTEDSQGIEWDGGEKFYEYIEWMHYIINKVFAPRGYVLNGSISWQGDDRDDIGEMVVENNTIMVRNGYVEYGPVVIALSADPDQKAFNPAKVRG